MKLSKTKMLSFFVIGLFFVAIFIPAIIGNKITNENADPFFSYHLATEEEIDHMKRTVGIYDNNKNYNIIFNGFGTGCAPSTEDEWDAMVGRAKIVNTQNVPMPLTLSSNDLSTDPCFPIVRSQGGQGSCSAWAATYYSAGYIQAKESGWTDASNGNNNQLLSPAFTHNKYNHGANGGSSTYGNGYVMESVGVCTWNEMPYDDTEYIDWGNENAWRDAPSYRIADCYFIYPYPDNYDDTDIAAIKAFIDNDQPVTFALDSGLYSSFGADDCLGSNLVYTLYNHANTIVGYDDSYTDVESGDTGAFKCVNSWGSGWGPNSNGFYHLTYEFFKDPGNVYPAVTFDDLYTTSSPNLIGVWKLNPQPDRDATIELGVGSYGSPLDTREPIWDGHTSTMHAMPDSTHDFMCLDITEFYDEWSSGTCDFYLEIGDSASNDGTITTFKVEYYEGVYNPGSPTLVSEESPDTPQSTPGYVRVTNFIPLTEQIDVNQSLFDRGFPIRHALDGDWAGSQSFTPGLGMISSVDLYLRKFGSPEFDLTVELRSGSPDGVLLDAVVFPAGEVPGSWGWLYVDVVDVVVEGGVEYFVVVPPAPSGVTTSFGYEWGYAYGDQYPDGAFWFTRDGGDLWRDLPTMYEFTFKTYGTESIVDIPPTAHYTWLDADGTGPNTQILFDATTSTDDHGIIYYEWDWNNDGTYDATGATPSYDYGDTFIHTVVLRVTDTISQMDTYSDEVQAITSSSSYCQMPYDDGNQSTVFHSDMYTGYQSFDDFSGMTGAINTLKIWMCETWGDDSFIGDELWIQIRDESLIKVYNESYIVQTGDQVAVGTIEWLIGSPTMYELTIDLPVEPPELESGWICAQLNHDYNEAFICISPDGDNEIIYYQNEVGPNFYTGYNLAFCVSED